MAKKFCITGTCVPEKNYMVDISDRIDRITKDYIEQGQYFTINRARQYGKTTTLFLLERKLREDYLVLSLSFEAADEYFESLTSLAEGLVLDIGECLREQNVAEKTVNDWISPLSEKFPMRSLGMKITSHEGTSTFIWRLDEMGSTSGAQSVLTVPRSSTVVSSVSDNGQASYADDPAQDITAYMAENGEAENEYKDGGQILVQLNADEVASVEYWLYLEGCDEQCSNPVQNRDSEIQLAFAGVDLEESEKGEQP